jgi:hypothetical protein
VFTVDEVRLAFEVAAAAPRGVTGVRLASSGRGVGTAATRGVAVGVVGLAGVADAAGAMVAVAFAAIVASARIVGDAPGAIVALGAGATCKEGSQITATTTSPTKSAPPSTQVSTPSRSSTTRLQPG